METYHIGILTAVRENEFKSEITYSGWIKSNLQESVYFRSNQLVKREQKKNVKNNCFISFCVMKNREKEDRLDAVKCILLSSRELVEQIERFSFEDISFIIHKVSKSLLSQLRTELKRAIEIVVDEAEREKLDQIRKLFDGESVVIEEETSSSFLDSIFNGNSDDYNRNLFQILIEGIKEIGNEEVYKQSKYLLEYGRKNPEWLSKSLCDEFYRKASYRYKIQLWLDSLINYVEPGHLKLMFENGSEDIKRKIKDRLRGAESLFTGNSDAEIERKGVQEVYFDGIRSKIIKELSAAKKTIKVAVAWFTNEELFAVLCQKLTEGVRVELILINDFINNSDFGLPFQEFIDRKGRLYFAEYPQVMHHKFCIIDNAVLFNGSYNWTYYAEDRNDENIMLFKSHSKLVSDFNKEFSRLKREIGFPVEVLERFDISKLAEQDFFGARNYLSRDLGHKARKAYASQEVLVADRYLEKALELAKDEHLEKFREEIKSEVVLYRDAAIAASIVSFSPDAVEGTDVRLLDDRLDAVDQALQIPDDYKNGRNNEELGPASDEVENVDGLEMDGNTSDGEMDVLGTIDAGRVRSEGDNGKDRVRSPITLPNVQPSSDKLTGNLSGEKPSSVSSQMRYGNSAGSHFRSPNTNTNTFKSKDEVYVPYVTGSSIISVNKEVFPRLKIVVGLDISGSMKELYNNGTMQRVLKKNFSAAMSLAEQDKVEVFAFNTMPQNITSVDKNNYSTYISNCVISKFPIDGGTEIAKFVERVFAANFEEKTPSHNVLVIVFTDGEDGKADELRKLIKNTASSPIFWQFVGIGSKFDILESLKNVEGRTTNNVGFYSANDIDKIESKELYSQLLLPFQSWFSEAKEKNIILK